MRSKFRIAAASSFALFAAFLSFMIVSVSRAGDEPKPAEGQKSKIAFIDVMEVINKYKRVQKLEADIEKFQTNRKKEIEAEKKDLAELKEDLDMLDPTGNLYNEKRKNYILLGSKITCEEKLLAEEVEHRLSRATREVFGNICKACEAWRKEHGCAAVFTTHRLDESWTTREKLAAGINAMSMIAYDPEMEITEEIVAILNG